MKFKNRVRRQLHPEEEGGIGQHTLRLITALLAVDHQNEYVVHGWSHGLDIDEVKNPPNAELSLSKAR